jgi:HEPN domain-containing protein
MSSGPYTQAQTLLLKAAEDERALQAPENSDAIVGFHAQQAVEKLMKALLSALNLPFELTHNLERLHVALQAAGESLPQTTVQLDQLTDYAVVYRYDLVYLMAPPDRAELAETVRTIREHVVDRIAVLSSTP